VSMLKLLFNTSVKANSLNANTSTSTGFYCICMPERSEYGYAAGNVVATIFIMIGPVLWIPPESPVGQSLRKIHDFMLFED